MKPSLSAPRLRFRCAHKQHLLPSLPNQHHVEADHRPPYRRIPCELGHGHPRCSAIRGWIQCIPMDWSPSMGLVSVGNRGVGNLRLIGLVGLGPASRVFTFHLLGSLLTTTTNISICPHMTSLFNSICTRTPVSLEALLLGDCPRRSGPPRANRAALSALSTSPHSFLSVETRRFCSICRMYI